MKEVVVITGAGNGIGFHMAKALLEDGFRVAALDVGSENLAPLRSAYADRLLIYECDVTDRERVRAAVSEIVDLWGSVDVLVNNACLALFRAFEQKPEEDTRREFEVNYFGYIHAIAAVLPHMKKQGRGIIHNMGSGVGITGFPGVSGYASTKGAVEALTRTLALEFKKYGICVNLMHPPLTNTKSASPLGVPAQVMDDPARVGRNLAKRILSTKSVVTPDFRTAAYLFLAYRYPGPLGAFFAQLTENAEKQEA